LNPAYEKVLYANFINLKFKQTLKNNIIVEKNIYITKDGSKTIHLPQWNESYHSKHGALQESEYVYIKNGFDYISKKNLAILEIGFGTGLNTLLTMKAAEEKRIVVNYEGVEAYPVAINMLNELNYPELVGVTNAVFNEIHATPWEVFSAITTHFNLKKRLQHFENITDEDSFDLIYFDAFGARVQPELWTVSIFQKMYRALRNGGVLITYSSKSSVRKAMLSLGFTVEKLPGPEGKREILRATKN